MGSDYYGALVRANSIDLIFALYHALLRTDFMHDFQRTAEKKSVGQQRRTCGRVLQDGGLRLRVNQDHNLTTYNEEIFSLSVRALSYPDVS